MSKCSLCLSSDYAERRLCSLCGETLCEECNPPQSDPCVECIWVDGPDSEAARAGRGEGWYDAWLRAPLTPAEQRMVDGVKPGEGLPMPDPDHVPAVRRMVAWEVNRALVMDRSDAYNEAARWLLHRAWNRCKTGRTYRRWKKEFWPARRIERLMSALRHRDEEAGHR